MNRVRLAVVAVAMLALLGATAAYADVSGKQRVRMKDDCDPASFNAAIGPGTCVGSGDTTFADFVAQLTSQGSADKWKFDRDKLDLGAGQAITVQNVGGEFHTFTEVRNFGGGCIPFLNGLLHLDPVPECSPLVAPDTPLAFVTSGVPAGGTRTFAGLTAGVHRFQCLIHPWMRTIVTVGQRD